jgi:2-methylcitrate dehydratase PrpD
MFSGDSWPSSTLAHFASSLTFEDIPEAVVQRTQELFADWFGSALACKCERQVDAIERFAVQMGCGAKGQSEVLVTRRLTTPLFAAMVNAAASHCVEQDDVHCGAVLHAGTHSSVLRDSSAGSQPCRATSCVVPVHFSCTTSV